MTTKLGVSWSQNETTFAVWSPDATNVHVCLFDRTNPLLEDVRARMSKAEDGVWSVTLPEVALGTPYGFRADGPYAPAKGQRFNQQKLLIDPYAREVQGHVTWHQPVFGYPSGNADSTKADLADNANFVPRSIIIDESFDWQGVTKPNVPRQLSVVYEAHLKGLTALHPDVSPHERGTYRGAAHPSVIAYLKDLGITALELLPIHTFLDDSFLLERGLVNYWGYNTLNFFSPSCSYACSTDPGEVVREFKEMVRAYHAAGIEIWLDVVYNHTAEANHQGPTLSFRGLANRQYYRLDQDQRYYLNYSGTGNTVNAHTPQVADLIVDSLVYWAEAMQVDGFRFDLAPVIGRTENDFDRESPLFKRLGEHPALKDVKLIAEPWDLGDGGYQLGGFPDNWSEWNDKYRDTIRSFWRSDDGKVEELGWRLTGSADIFHSRPLGPAEGVNFIAAHDGMTGWDVVSYHAKRNFGNGDNNQDGHDNDIGQYIGSDGFVTDPIVLRNRYQRQRNLLATLFISRGIPMLLGGDEIARTQQGNNNAYCQDNPVSWINWNLNAGQIGLRDFVRDCIALRRAEPALHVENFPTDEIADSDPWYWFAQDGHRMESEQWHNPEERCFGILLDSSRGGNLIILINAGGEDCAFALPAPIAIETPGTVVLLTTAESHDGTLVAPRSSLTVFHVPPVPGK
ncbi:MAG TPA: glycogen debranching protein GlgX [Thermomicrobiales bacterium]|nr:glycogen debranching protein GlgX [Thermomicrobiales bacterium]